MYGVPDEEVTPAEADDRYFITKMLRDSAKTGGWGSVVVKNLPFLVFGFPIHVVCSVLSIPIALGLLVFAGYMRYRVALNPDALVN